MRKPNILTPTQVGRICNLTARRAELSKALKGHRKSVALQSYSIGNVVFEKHYREANVAGVNRFSTFYFPAHDARLRRKRNNASTRDSWKWVSGQEADKYLLAEILLNVSETTLRDALR